MVFRRHHFLVWLLMLVGIVSGCSTATSAGGDRVRVVNATAAVANCRDVGKVHVEGPVYTAAGGFIGAAGDRANLRKNKTAELGGNTLLRVGEEDDEAYDCPGYPSNAVHIVSLKPGSEPAGAATPSRVLIVGGAQYRSLMGCDYVGVLKTTFACPPGQDAETCTAYRAAQDQGNAVLDGSPLRVYRCPEAQMAAAGVRSGGGPGTISVVSSASVKVVASEDELKGCVYVDRVNVSISCPPEYPEGPACMAYRARQQEGNAVLAQGAGKVYRCPASPP